MTKLSVFLAATASLALAACASETPEDATSNAAADYAARINGDKSGQAGPAPAATVAPKVAPPREGAAPGAFAAGTATDPNSACKANLFGEFLGQQPTDEVRAQILEAAADIPEVRFVTPGSGFIPPDPTHPRLNFMIALDGVIRDIRCG
ncbi:MAG: hypothetical protein AAFY47_05990 [Pseudomonadota bacterium]